MVSIFFLFRNCRKSMIADIFMKSIRKKYLDMKVKKECDWTWLINFIYDAFFFNQKINRSGQSNPSKWKIHIYHIHITVYLKCQCILFNILDIMMHLSRASMWISFIIQANDDFDKWLDIISFLLWKEEFWGFLEGKKILMSCCQWMTMGDGWLNIYWIYIIVYIYHGLCWEAHLMNHIS